MTGTAGNDTIDRTGANPDKMISGLGGNDTVTGTSFNDTIDGGTGRTSYACSIFGCVLILRPGAGQRGDPTLRFRPTNQFVMKASRSALNSCSWAPVNPCGAPG